MPQITSTLKSISIFLDVERSVIFGSYLSRGVCVWVGGCGLSTSCPSHLTVLQAKHSNSGNNVPCIGSM